MEDNTKAALQQILLGVRHNRAPCSRWVLEPEDVILLERVFALEKCPGRELRQQLAEHLNVTSRQVQVSNTPIPLPIPRPDSPRPRQELQLERQSHRLSARCGFKISASGRRTGRSRRRPRSWRDLKARPFKPHPGGLVRRSKTPGKCC